MKRYDFLENFNYKKFINKSLIKKYLLNYKPQNPALIILDMQNIFCLSDSKHYIPSVKSIIKNINILSDFFYKRKLPVIFTKHINNKQNAGMMLKRYKKLIMNNNESDLLDDYKHNSIIIVKTQFNAFYKSDLQRLLEENNIKTLIIAGIMSERCVSTTAREGFVRGYKIVLPIDCITTYYREVYEGSIISLANSVADICLAEDIIEKLQ